jgi:DNA-binding NtrC family response regulator
MKPGAMQQLPSGREVLVVEDEGRIRQMLSQALMQMGFEPTLAPTAETAMKVMAQRVFDILILDLNLPGMNGMEFLESLRSRKCDTQVIILTGFGDLEAARKAIHFDVVEFLTKPCTLGSLEMALDRAHKRRKGQIVGEFGNDPEHLMEFEGQSPDPEEPSDSSVRLNSLGMPSLEEVEMQHILRVLKTHNGNRAAMAAELGISIRKLYYRISQYQKKGII